MSESTADNLIELDGQMCRMGKYANNVELHGEDHARGWKVPFEDVMLTPQQINVLYGDPHTDRAWFNTKKDLKEPMPWVMKSPPTFPDKFEEAAVIIEISGGRELEFDDCSIQIDSLEPQVGGLTKTKLSVYLHPDDKQMLQIDLHQYREVKLSIADAKVALKKKSKQQELPLEQAQEPAAAAPAEPKADVKPAPTAKADPPKKNGKTTDEKFGDDIGPKTRAEIEARKSRRGAQAINGRKGAH